MTVQQQALLRAALTTQVSATQDDVVPPLHTATATSSEQPSSSWTPQFEPYFSNPSGLSTPTLDQGDTDAFASNTMDGTTDQEAQSAYAALEGTLRVTAPDNWPMLIEALTAAYDEYVLMYESIYDEAYRAQKASSSSFTFTSSPTPPLPSQSDLLTSVESTLLGWDPIEIPSDTMNAASTSSGSETQYVYQQVTHQGLPYLLRISTLRSVIDKLDNITMLGRLISSRQSQPSPTLTQLSGSSASGRTIALERGGFVSNITLLTRNIVASLREVTFADVSAVIVPMFFVGFKVGILLSVMLRGAEGSKKWFLLGMASIYVLFESFRIVQRRMRVRQRTAVAPPAQDVQNPPAHPPTPAPMGANVPTAPSHEENVEQQATQNPHLPLPPPRAPARFTHHTRYSYDWWLDHLAFIGLDVEDSELGLQPSSPDAADSSRDIRQKNWVERILISSWVLPLVLFVVTMMPAVEQRRKRAIEERERVIRKWTRLETERRERLAELEKEKEEGGENGGNTNGNVGREGEDMELQEKRAEYAERILRQEDD